jgi:hypothetical protein
MYYKLKANNNDLENHDNQIDFQKNDGSLAIYLVYKEGLTKEIIY